MAERKHRSPAPGAGLPQNAFDLDAHAQQVAGDIAAIRTYLDELKGPGYAEFQRGFARFLFGREKKTVTAPDGTTTQVDYSDEDFFREDQRQLEEAEGESRVEMTQDISFALNTQWRFTLIPNGRRYAQDHRRIVGLSAALLHRVVSSDDSIADDRPMDITETRWEAEALEVVRRTVMQPYYGVVEGLNEGAIYSIPSFFDIRGTWTYAGDPDQIAKDRKLDKILEVQKAKGGDLREIDRQLSADRVESYGDAKWMNIFDAEQVYLFEYLQGCMERTLTDSRGSRLFMARAVRGGQMAFSPDEISQSEGREITVKSIEEEFSKLKTLTDAEGWIKTRFGPEATFQTLLQTLNPIGLRGSTEDFMRQYFIV